MNKFPLDNNKNWGEDQDEEQAKWNWKEKLGDFQWNQEEPLTLLTITIQLAFIEVGHKS